MDSVSIPFTQQEAQIAADLFMIAAKSDKTNSIAMENCMALAKKVTAPFAQPIPTEEVQEPKPSKANAKNKNN